MAQFTPEELQFIVGELFSASDPAKSELSPRQVGGYRIARPQGFKVFRKEALPSGAWLVTLGWLDITFPVPVKGYKIYGVDTATFQTARQPALVGGATRSPAQVVVETTASSSYIFYLQPYLASGLELPVDTCPTATITT